MKVIVVGVGEVGSTTAADLAADNEVTVVDIDADRVDAIQYEEDVPESSASASIPTSSERACDRVAGADPSAPLPLPETSRPRSAARSAASHGDSTVPNCVGSSTAVCRFYCQVGGDSD